MGQKIDPGSGYDLPYRLSLIEQQIQSLFKNGPTLSTPESTYRHFGGGRGAEGRSRFLFRMEKRVAFGK